MTYWEHLPKEAVKTILDKYGPKVYRYEIHDLVLILLSCDYPEQVYVIEEWLKKRKIFVEGETIVNPSKE